DDSGLRRRFADINAHDVRQNSAAYEGIRTGLVLPLLGTRLRQYHRRLWKDAAVGSAASNINAVRDIEHAGCDDRALHLRSERLLSGSRYRRNPRRIRV